MALAPPPKEVLCCRYGSAGQAVLLFPTAGGDAEESERFWMISVLGELLEKGKIRVYTVDSAAGKVWTDGESSGAHRAWFQNRFDDFVASEVVPLIRRDCGRSEGRGHLRRRLARRVQRARGRSAATPNSSRRRSA